MQPRAEFEVDLCLIDYLEELQKDREDPVDREEVLNAVRGDYLSAAMAAFEEVKEMGLAGKVKLVSIKLIEFCSTNPHHGAAHFQVVVTSDIFSSGEMQALINEHMAYDPEFPHCE